MPWSPSTPTARPAGAPQDPLSPAAGYSLRPFGSYVSGTAVHPAALDVALYRTPGAPELDLELDPAAWRLGPRKGGEHEVEAFVQLLLQSSGFLLLRPQSPPGVRLLAQGFKHERSSQESGSKRPPNRSFVGRLEELLVFWAIKRAGGSISCLGRD